MKRVKVQQVQRFNPNRNASGLWIVRKGRTILGHIERLHNDVIKTYYAMVNGRCVGTCETRKTAIKYVVNGYLS